MMHSPMRTRSQAAAVESQATATVPDAEMLRTREQEASREMRETLEEAVRMKTREMQELRRERDLERQELRELPRRDAERQM